MPSPPSFDPQQVRAAWPELRALILDEWHDLDVAAVDETAGDADALVTLVAEHGERTRAMTRRLLAELLLLAREQQAPAPPPSRAPRATSRRVQAAAATADSNPLDPFDRLVSSLEDHMEDLARQVKDDVTPLAVDTARRHLGLSLLLAGGIGLMVGLFLGALGYPHDPDALGEDPDDHA